jgi:dTDP-4-amino-4,6-dideoxygalactose transaminase
MLRRSVTRPKRRAGPGSRQVLVTRPSLPPLPEYVRLLRGIWKRRWLTNSGPFLREFERGLRRYLRVPRVDAVVNGTVALQIAYRAVFSRTGIVITTPFTYAATTTSLLWERYTPRFADIDPDTFNLDPDSVADRLGEGVVGIVAVHAFGNPAGAHVLDRLATRHSLGLVFDAAHSFGLRFDSGSPFDLGDASILSFHATKNFHTFEGGAVVSPRSDVSRRVRRLRNFGFGSSDFPEEPGINGKLNEAQAAMGLLNLRYVDRWIRARKLRYEHYRDLLSKAPPIRFQKLAPCRYNYPYMPILLGTRRQRDRVYRNLVRSRVEPRKYFFPPLHRIPIIPQSMRAQCPVADNVSSRVLCLPLYPDLPFNQVRRIARIVLRSIEG